MFPPASAGADARFRQFVTPAGVGSDIREQNFGFVVTKVTDCGDRTAIGDKAMV
jgi:hypothetical protein